MAQVASAALAAVPAEVSPKHARGQAIALKCAAGAVLLALWEIVVRLAAPAYVARPSGIVRAFVPVITDAQFLAAAGATLASVIEGLAIAVVLGALIGVAMGRLPRVDQALKYYVNSLFATPMVAILPLLTLWFGYTSAARLAAVVFAAIFSIIVNCADGARAVPGDYLEVARSFRSRPAAMLFDVVLPASLPYLLAGFRLAAGRALIGAVVAEFFVSIPGLGYYILFNSRTFKHNEAFVAVIVLAALGLFFQALADVLTRRYLPWARRG